MTLSARQAAINWLSELKAEISMLGVIDYRTPAYQNQLEKVLRLCKAEYVENALAAIGEES